MPRATQTITGLDPLLTYFKKLDASLRPGGMEEAGKFIADRMRAAKERAFDTASDPVTGTPWPVRTWGDGSKTGTLRGESGLLESSITETISVQGDSISVTQGPKNDVVYAWILFRGGDIPPHAEYPRTAKAMQWWGSDGQKRFSAGSETHHPGAHFPARRYMGLSGTDMRAIADFFRRRAQRTA